MKKIYGIDQLVDLGAALDENESQPCILVAPELLGQALSEDEITVREEGTHHRAATAFVPVERRRGGGVRGIERITDIESGTVRYASILDGHIACGVTRASPQGFEAARLRMEGESSTPVEVGRIANGDLIQMFVHRTSGGPGVVIAVQTARLLPGLTQPRVALDPFGTHGWQYLSSLFETAAFFWAITDGERAFLLSSVQHFYPDLVERVHQRCLSLRSSAHQRSWARTLAEIRQQLR